MLDVITDVAVAGYSQQSLKQWCKSLINIASGFNDELNRRHLPKDEIEHWTWLVNNAVERTISATEKEIGDPDAVNVALGEKLLVREKGPFGTCE